MQQVAIINYNTGAIDIYPYPDNYPGYVDDWITEKFPNLSPNDYYWIHKHGIVPVTIHA